MVDHSFRHSFSTHMANEYGELLASTLTGHHPSSVAITELAKSYYHGATWTKKKQMVESLPKLNGDEV